MAGKLSENKLVTDMSVREKEKQETLERGAKTEQESQEKGTPKIFLSGSIRGGRQLLPVYRLIYETLEGAGAEVVSWHVVDPELEKVESAMTEEEIYARDLGLLAKSDAMLAEVTVPSLGVGYEVCRALVLGIPVLCLHRPDAAVSAMLLGNPEPGIRVRVYSDEGELRKILMEFLSSF
ncbi:nucleoside 2-deoxyribosyltransferase [Methanosarcina sp. MTP4]|uniref:nucleoside 2-deoxyribosyltransferase n=1 Tax=Methanosarcina sp. MTP4 TaxID=1434100 RepID=UPI000AB00695